MISRKKLSFIFIFLFLGLLARNVYISSYIKGLQSEARIMLPYILSLEKIYHSEHGKYVPFIGFYGAPINGKDNCVKPKGADKIGFKLSWCETGYDALYFAYSVVRSKDKPEEIIVIAESGSDAKGRSFVCFGKNQKNLLHLSSHNNKIIAKESCLPKLFGVFF